MGSALSITSVPLAYLPSTPGAGDRTILPLPAWSTLRKTRSAGVGDGTGDMEGGDAGEGSTGDGVRDGLFGERTGGGGDEDKVKVVCGGDWTGAGWGKDGPQPTIIARHRIKDNTTTRPNFNRRPPRINRSMSEKKMLLRSFCAQIRLVMGVFDPGKLHINYTAKEGGEFRLSFFAIL
jgi:hypothetical protein